MRKEFDDILNRFYRLFSRIEDTWLYNDIKSGVRHFVSWCDYINTLNNHVKNSVKLNVINSMINKMKDDPRNYTILETFLNKRPKFNKPGSFDYVRKATHNHIYYTLHRALKNTPEHIKDSLKYNL